MTHLIKHIDIIVGLPGSGKTTMAHTISTEDNTFVIDDLSIVYKHSEGQWEKVFNLPDNMSHLVITDVSACSERTQEFLWHKLKEFFPEASQTWTFFANDKAACEKNIQSRNDGRDVSITLKLMEKNFFIGEFIKTHADKLNEKPVYRVIPKP